MSGFTSPTVAGTPQTFTITARDANGNTASGYRGTVHVTSTDGQATLPLDHTFTSTEGGTATLAATLKTAGSAAITATDTVAASVSGSQTGIRVTAAAPATIKVDPASASIAAGGSAVFAVSGADAYGNAVTIVASWSASSGDASCTAAGSCTSSKAGSYTITATVGTVTATAALTVTTAVLDHIAVSPSSQTISYGGSAAFTAKAYDKYENEIPTSIAWSSLAAAGCDGVTGKCTPLVANTSGYSVTASAGTVSGSATLIVSKAAATLSFSGGPFTYSGAAQGPSVATTPSGLGLLLRYTGTTNGGVAYDGAVAPVSAGSYTLAATIVDPSYDGSRTTTFAIARAASTTTVAWADGSSTTFSGAAHLAVGTTKDGGGVIVATPTIGYALGTTALPGAPADAGDYTATATFAGADNYQPSAGSATITIARATPTVTVAPVSVTYDGAPHGTTAAVTGVGGSDLGAATLTYGTSGGAAPVNAGSYSATGTYAGSANYTGATGSATVVLSKATASVTIVPVASATYDAKTHGTTASVSGAGGLSQTVPVTYNGAMALPVNAGTYTATATFAGDANHAGATASTTIVINKAAGGSVEYSGQETWTTANATTFTATVTSSATVEVLTGDVTTATVSLSLDGGTTVISGCANVAVVLVRDLSGSATCAWTATVPVTGSQSYTVTAVLGGNYAAALSTAIVLVTLPEPSGDKKSN